ncbi:MULTISPECIES: recombination protein NinG [Photorhabdus]|uniref:Recombination protein NinG n=1 Tax=Photorhabdus kayaii TaxID=230088 RepID=A0ABX0B076_9GAMM|nr:MULTISPECIES: recombination protein NinG [Photorhabdus]MCC8376393.1 recombination protein NinG [Photorhabdus bodei]MCT8353850.1 recombination protein NinG [Photorhabdus kayaii]NDL14398.1 recombination protein NinG [Photorhabdus kayaii]NDL23936.1 recombination protein NinG [Photorhabdus kayaii]RAX12532.1 protein NinG [Photorhabdus sp. HUG-39]
MKKLRIRKCKACRREYQPVRQLQNTCSIECAIVKGSKDQKKKKEKLERELKKKQQQELAEKKDKLKARRLAIKPRSYFIQQAQRSVNAYIRYRDKDKPCVSCGACESSRWDAGHYRTTSAAPQLRFDERNIQRQCIVCNQHHSGNLVLYRIELIERIGIEAVENIESNHDRHRWTIEECKAIKAEFDEKLKKLRSLSNDNLH